MVQYCRVSYWWHFYCLCHFLNIVSCIFIPFSFYSWSSTNIKTARGGDKWVTHQQSSCDLRIANQTINKHLIPFNKVYHVLTYPKTHDCSLVLCFLALTFFLFLTLTISFSYSFLLSFLLLLSYSFLLSFPHPYFLLGHQFMVQYCRVSWYIDDTSTVFAIFFI